MAWQRRQTFYIQKELEPMVSADVMEELRVLKVVERIEKRCAEKKKDRRCSKSEW